MLDIVRRLFRNSATLDGRMISIQKDFCEQSAQTRLVLLQLRCAIFSRLYVEAYRSRVPLMRALSSSWQLSYPHRSCREVNTS